MGYEDRRLERSALVAGKGSKIHAAYVPAGGSRFRRQHEIRLTRTVIDIKVSTLDTDGALSVAEVTSLRKGGPASARSGSIFGNR